MAAKKLLRLLPTGIAEIFGVQISAGVANAGDIPALDDTGRLHTSLMPVGIGADTASITASEALAAGEWVNVWNSAGAKVRKADATTTGKEAHGFVLEAVANGAQANVYFEGTNTQVTGQTPGSVFLQATAGAGGPNAPAAAGNIVQRVGIATGPTTVNFEAGVPVTLA